MGQDGEWTKKIKAQAANLSDSDRANLVGFNARNSGERALTEKLANNESIWSSSSTNKTSDASDKIVKAAALTMLGGSIAQTGAQFAQMASIFNSTGTGSGAVAGAGSGTIVGSGAVAGNGTVAQNGTVSEKVDYGAIANGYTTAASQGASLAKDVQSYLESGDIEGAESLINSQEQAQTSQASEIAKMTEGPQKAFDAANKAFSQELQDRYNGLDAKENEFKTAIGDERSGLTKEAADAATAVTGQENLIKEANYSGQIQEQNRIITDSQKTIDAYPARESRLQQQLSATTDLTQQATIQNQIADIKREYDNAVLNKKTAEGKKTELEEAQTKANEKLTELKGKMQEANRTLAEKKQEYKKWQEGEKKTVTQQYNLAKAAFDKANTELNAAKDAQKTAQAANDAWKAQIATQNQALDGQFGERKKGLFGIGLQSRTKN